MKKISLQELRSLIKNVIKENQETTFRNFEQDEQFLDELRDAMVTGDPFPETSPGLEGVVNAAMVLSDEYADQEPGSDVTSSYMIAYKSLQDELEKVYGSIGLTAGDTGLGTFDMGQDSFYE